MGRVDRMIDRSNRLYDRSIDAAMKGKSRKAARLKKRSQKLDEKMRGVACKINARGKKVCKRTKRRGGFNTHHPTKRRNRY
tara:strand:- start:81 stop:323 length:243 start_codon:yes stop_codon:yes gene_type:complete